jgi:hypothetical protein
MHTKLLMNVSAAVMAVVGVAATFAPREMLERSGAHAELPAVLLVQILGAVYLGFAMLNWMARENLIGGIYSRPVGLGNFFHFAIAGVALMKLVLNGSGRNAAIVMAAVIYSALAIWFAAIVFTHPTAKTKSAE